MSLPITKCHNTEGSTVIGHLHCFILAHESLVQFTLVFVVSVLNNYLCVSYTFICLIFHYITRLSPSPEMQRLDLLKWRLSCVSGQYSGQGRSSTWLGQGVLIVCECVRILGMEYDLLVLPPPPSPGIRLLRPGLRIGVVLRHLRGSLMMMMI